MLFGLQVVSVAPFPHFSVAISPPILRCGWRVRLSALNQVWARGREHGSGRPPPRDEPLRAAGAVMRCSHTSIRTEGVFASLSAFGWSHSTVSGAKSDSNSRATHAELSEADRGPGARRRAMSAVPRSRSRLRRRRAARIPANGIARACSNAVQRSRAHCGRVIASRREEKRAARARRLLLSSTEAEVHRLPGLRRLRRREGPQSKPLAGSSQGGAPMSHPYGGQLRPRRW